MSAATNGRRGYVITAAAALCFAFYPATSSLLYSSGANASLLIITSTLVRATFLIAAAVLRGYSLGEVVKGSWTSLPAGFLQAVTIFGILGSLEFIPGPVTITILFTHTLMLLILLHWRGEARMTRLALLTSVAALLGISMVVNIYDGLGSMSGLGLLMAFVAALATTGRVYAYGKQVLVSPPEIVGGRAFAQAFLFTLLLVPVLPPVLPHGTYGYLYLALSCLSLSFGSFLTFWALKEIGSFRVSLLLKVEPVLGCICSWVLLGQTLQPIQYLGIMLVFISLATYQMFGGRSC